MRIKNILLFLSLIFVSVILCLGCIATDESGDAGDSSVADQEDSVEVEVAIPELEIEEPGIEGYGDYALGMDIESIRTELESYEYSDETFADDVGVYTLNDDFVTEQATLPIEINLYVQENVLLAIQLQLRFSRTVHTPLFSGTQYGQWRPDISVLSEVRDMLVKKYSEMETTHDYSILEQGGLNPELKLVIRDSYLNAISVTWENNQTEGKLKIRYATGGFFDEFWNEGEVQRQFEKL